ncbi:hypothetical protein ACJMK2_032697 [Sinanodonta woodiana]|uniref:Uncharacterized protein n=1 Tax=Sinanodonta woodiana TaxID=1069815 RepID=A0ABD3X2R4_SINWO
MGSSIMEWKVLFFQLLVIMLGASQVTNACSCSFLSWEEMLCPGQNKTVVKATVLSVEGLNYDGNFAEAPPPKYQMRLESSLANGSIPLNVTDGKFTMLFPLDANLCGRSLSNSTEYLLAGDVYQGGGFYSNMCQMAFPSDDLDDNDKSVLNGTIPLNCDNIIHRVYKEDQL